MAQMIFCEKLKQEEEALDYRPFPGPLGERILKHISKKAWQMWLNQQTILINEYRLNTLDPNARKFLMEEMEKFLFGSS